MTLDDLAELLRLPQGHRLEAVAETPDGTRPGILVTLSGDLKGISHTRYEPGEPIRIIRLGEYRRRTEVVVRDPPGFPVPWADLDAAGCIDPSGQIDWPKWERGKAPPPPPPAVPPGMPLPVTKSDPPEYVNPPQYGQPVSYMPTRPPVVGSDPDTWPPFPGERPYTSPADHRDPGDEDIHTGGPR